MRYNRLSEDNGFTNFISGLIKLMYISTIKKIKISGTTYLTKNIILENVYQECIKNHLHDFYLHIGKIQIYF